MTEEATNQQEEVTENTVADNNPDFYSKLAALTGSDDKEVTEDKVQEYDDNQEDETLESGQEEDLEEEQEIDADDDDDFAPDGKNPIPYGRWKKMVDRKNALAAEREKEKEERLRYQVELENYQKAMEQYFESTKLNEKQSSEEADTDQLDPLDETSHAFYMKHIEELKKEIGSIKGNVATKDDINTQRAAQQFEYDVAKQRAEFESSTPDYTAALTHLQNVKMEEQLVMHGSKDEAAPAVLRDILNIASSAYKTGKNVPETIYNLAKRYGYSPNAPTGKANIDALKNNMKRGASDTSSRAALPMGTGNYTQPGYLKKLKGADGAVEGAKFHEILNKVIKGN